jgi:16S rRNA (uracil1498-N3)-methyltransferase
MIPLRISSFIISIAFAATAFHFDMHRYRVNRHSGQLFLDQCVSIDDSIRKYSTIPRLYVGDPPNRRDSDITLKRVNLEKGVQIHLDSDQAHYVTKVMRIDGRKKNHLRIFDGQSGEWLARVDVTKVTKNQVHVHVTCIENIRKQEIDIGPWILFAPLHKKSRIKHLLEKCTELGASQFLALQTEHTEISSYRDFQNSVEKSYIHLVEASEQCERLTLPTLTCMSENLKSSNDNQIRYLLESWEALVGKEQRYLLICRERNRNAIPLLDLFIGNGSNSIDTSSNISFLIGPEGGWSKNEEVAFDTWQSSCPLIHSISLGSNVLRAETAALTVMAAFRILHDSHTVGNLNHE